MASCGNCAALAFATCSTRPSFPCSYSDFPSFPWDWRDSRGEDGGGVGPRIWCTSAPARPVQRSAKKHSNIWSRRVRMCNRPTTSRSSTGALRCPRRRGSGARQVLVTAGQLQQGAHPRCGGAARPRAESRHSPQNQEKNPAPLSPSLSRPAPQIT